MNKLIVKNLVKILCFAVLFFVTCQNITAQNSLVPNIIPPSPEAASLGKFVEVPVSHYTGLPNISVPLYTIESGGISLPIQVSYHARGVQVSEIASQVGIGWALNAGGLITRQVRGQADESNSGYLTENFYNTFYTSKETRERVLAGSTSGVDPENLMDMEPDVYMFNFLNFSGKFIFDQKTKLPIIQKYSDFKIVPIYETVERGIKGWIITDKDGVQYYFGTSKDGLRRAIDRPQSTSSFVFLSQGGLQNPSNSTSRNNAWQLMDIVTPGNKQIKFEYVRDQAEYFSKSFDDGPLSALNCHFSKIIMDQYQIKAIYFDKGKVLFTKSTTQREDLRSSYALQKIEVYGIDNILRVKHSFNYSYSNSEDINSLYYLRTTELQAKKRMFLESIITEGDINTKKGKKYSFIYDPQVLPNRFSTSQDSWGYYNGKPNGEYSSFFEGDNRQVDTIKSGAGMLTKIIYPTGGSASFEYEHNKVIPPSYYKELLLNPTTPTGDKNFVLLKDGLLYSNGVYKDTFEVGGDPSKIFTLKSSIIFGGNTTSCSRTSNNANCPFDVTVYRVNPRTYMGNLYIGTGNNAGSIDLGPGIYVVEVRAKTAAGQNPDDENDSFSVRLNWTEPISDVNKILFAAGKRIKRIVMVDNMGGQISKTYEYLNSSKESTGRTFSIPNMYYIMGTIANGTPVINQIGATAGSPLTNFQGNALGYSFVTEFNGENSNNIGKAEYTFTMPEDTGDFYKFPYHSPTDNEWLRGAPLNIKYYSALKQNNVTTYDPVKEVKNTYRYADETNSVLSLTGSNPSESPEYLSTRRKFSFPLAIFIKNESASGFDAYYDANSYKFYYTMGGTVDLFSTEETEYFKNGGEFKKNTKYFYNYDSNYQLKSSQIKSSDQQTLETKYFYAPDPEMVNEPFRNELINKYMIGIPMATKTFKNNGGIKLSEQKTVYDNSAATSNLLLPRYIYSNKGANNIDLSSDKKISFDQYDDKGNITQYTVENGSPVSIIWGYSQTQPIAKIENATNAQIAAALGVSSINALNENNLAAINALRNNVSYANTMISTYTHIPLVGISTITDPKGETITYTYDSFGRLEFVKDKNNHILSENQYNYKQ